MAREGCPAAVPEDHGLAAALTKVLGHFSRRDRAAWGAVAELRSAATPGNGFRSADVPAAVRPRVAAAMRAVAADGHPEAARLGQLADALDPAGAAPAVAGAAPEPEPVPRPAPAPAPVAGQVT